MKDWQVLLVDDEPDSLLLLHDMLAVNGVHVHQAAGGKQCLDLLKTILPTLIVLDLAMPMPDGWELLNQIRANPAIQHVPVVAITAYHSTALARQVLEAGFDAYVPKPITRDFLAKLQEVAGRG